MASRSLNKVMLIGHLGKDAETRFTQSGTAVTNLTVATSRRYKSSQTGEWQEDTEWHDVVLWKAENLANYLQKGKQVYVEGRLQTRSWEDQSGVKKYRTEVIADPFGVILLSSRDEAGGGAPSGGGNRPAAKAQPAAAGGDGGGGGGKGDDDFGDQGITDDDVPF
ncbi:MAG TPA: single-stranded DNA-binding protein [Bryobacterales bacterium]|nr:single-stranded DNA-binding protein [Bryobacterales bacterium]